MRAKELGHQPTRTVPDPTEPSQIQQYCPRSTRTVPDKPEPSQIHQNHPRPTRTVPDPPEPSQTHQNRPRPTRTVPDPPEPSQTQQNRPSSPLDDTRTTSGHVNTWARPSLGLVWLLKLIFSFKKWWCSVKSCYFINSRFYRKIKTQKNIVFYDKKPQTWKSHNFVRKCLNFS